MQRYSGPESGRTFSVKPADAERFEAQFIAGRGCWFWLGQRDVSGYGVLHLPSVRRGPVKAHRIAYRLYVGPIPNGSCVRHACDNRGCVNPDHLELGPHVVNMADMFERGGEEKSFALRNRRKEVCPQGHPLSGPNLLMQGNRRKCRACRAESCRRRYRRRRAEEAATQSNAA